MPAANISEMESDTRKIRFQKDWLKILDAECAETGEPFAELVKLAVAREMKRRKKPLPEMKGRGRPKKEADDL